MSTEQQETSSDSSRPSVKTFKPTAFQLSEFEVVAKGEVVESFQAAQFVSLGSEAPAVDPMFEVYDGLFTPETSSEETVGEFDEEQSQEAELETAAESGIDADSTSESGEHLGTEGENKGEGEDAGFDLEAHERELAAKQAEEDRKALEEEHARQLEEARAAAKEEALADARREGEERLKALEERYAALLDDMGIQIRENVESVERQAVELAVHISKKLVGAIVEINPEYVLGIIKEAVKLTGGATIKAIRVSPQDLEFLKMLSPEKQFKEFDGSWSFQADETIHAGCVVETSSGQVEFDLEKAWERIKESVLKVR
jgi:flagellar biosynthesis/type III secretory pathway protein FliH